MDDLTAMRARFSEARAPALPVLVSTTITLFLSAVAIGFDSGQPVIKALVFVTAGAVVSLLLVEAADLLWRTRVSPHRELRAKVDHDQARIREALESALRASPLNPNRQPGPESKPVP
jgi:hypothetical protein